jgi:hypothetical protein
MAIKERKQITGTTAQINAYEGHEGQIVWDKDKKTFVGMSGTAGKNYPLAPKEYVDNEVAKVDAEVQKTNAKLTDGLAGKEDKGACLPLTGGILTGALRMTKDTYIWVNQDETIKGLEVSSGETWEDGAGLFLRNNSATGEGESGQWGLIAHNVASGTDGILYGRADNLWFNGELVERSSEVFGSVIDGGFYDVYRYATGLQIIIAGVTIPGNQVGLTFTFPRPFINRSYSIAANAYTDYGDMAVTWALDTTTSIKLYRKYYNGNYNLPSYVKCAFIGKWK